MVRVSSWKAGDLIVKDTSNKSRSDDLIVAVAFKPRTGLNMTFVASATIERLKFAIDSEMKELQFHASLTRRF